MAAARSSSTALERMASAALSAATRAFRVARKASAGPASAGGSRSSAVAASASEPRRRAASARAASAAGASPRASPTGRTLNKVVRLVEIRSVTVLAAAEAGSRSARRWAQTCWRVTRPTAHPMWRTASTHRVERRPRQRRGGRRARVDRAFPGPMHPARAGRSTALRFREQPPVAGVAVRARLGLPPGGAARRCPPRSAPDGPCGRTGRGVPWPE